MNQLLCAVRPVATCRRASGQPTGRPANLPPGQASGRRRPICELSERNGCSLERRPAPFVRAPAQPDRVHSLACRAPEEQAKTVGEVGAVGGGSGAWLAVEAAAAAALKRLASQINADWRDMNPARVAAELDSYCCWPDWRCCIIMGSSSQAA